MNDHGDDEAHRATCDWNLYPELRDDPHGGCNLGCLDAREPGSAHLHIGWSINDDPPLLRHHLVRSHGMNPDPDTVESFTPEWLVQMHRGDHGTSELTEAVEESLLRGDDDG